MQFSAAQIALLVNGKVEGDANVLVNGFGKIENATDGQLSFLSNVKYEEFIYDSDASVVLLNEGLELRKPVKPTLIRVADAYTALAILLNKYQQLNEQLLIGIQEPVYIDKSARYGEKVYIGAFCFVSANVVIGNNTKIYPGCFIGKNVEIGENSRIDPGVMIYDNCKIGNYVTINAGSVIGSEGFGFAPQPDGSHMRIPQIGNVIIEDHVDIGANVMIDRATLSSTKICSGAKLDNLVHIAHNVEVGSNTVIAAQVGISGSTRIGRDVMIGGQAGIVGHIELGDGVKVNAQSGVTKSWESGKAVTGSPAFEYTAALRSQAIARKLPELEKRLKELEDKMKKRPGTGH